MLKIPCSVCGGPCVKKSGCHDLKGFCPGCFEKFRAYLYETEFHLQALLRERDMILSRPAPRWGDDGFDNCSEVVDVLLPLPGIF